MTWILAAFALLSNPRGMPEITAVPGPSEPAAKTHSNKPATATLGVPPASAPTPPQTSEMSVRGAGHGITWTSADDRFELTLNLRGQVRYQVTDAPARAPAQSLSLRRARIKFSGHAFSEHNEFKLELGLSPRDMGMTEEGPRNTPILDWSFELSHLRDLTVRIGQYKLPYSRTRMQSSADLQFVDRSLADGEFNLNRDIGFDLRSYDLFGLGHLRYYAGVFLGEGRDAYQPTNFEMVYLGRFEILPFGQFASDDEESDLERSERPRMVLGGAYAFVDGAQRDRGTHGSTPADGGTSDLHNATADVLFKVRGFAALGEAFFRSGSRIPAAFTPARVPLDAPRSGLGWNTQASYLMGWRPLELAGRYGEIRGLPRTALEPAQRPGAAVSYYFVRHGLKLQLDYHATFEGSRDRPSHAIRLQFQAAL